MPERTRIETAGVVQGIGFRPFVYRLATDLALTGFVRNDSAGVIMELQGEREGLDRFETRLRGELPDGGRLDRLTRSSLPPDPAETGFAICRSDGAEIVLMTLAPDRSVCDACLAELREPADRRYLYPFINCTHCGPRYTITEQLPYDRPNTTMATFPLCPACRAEYEAPWDRRYHAQPVACPVCGPRAWLHQPGDGSDSPPPRVAEPAASARAISRAAAHLAEGRVVAVKGIGGFHLAANGASEGAVMRLRSMKNRLRKPFALMVRDLAVARELVHLDGAACELLASPAAPILLARRRDGVRLSEWIAPGLDDLGIMLPYTPLHHLLLEEGPPVLVMTSGNAAGEPIATENREACETLSADIFLLHDRDIAVANDDSVIRDGVPGPLFIRRSRGYVPDSIDVGCFPGASVLALGALLKVTVAALHRGRLTVGRHLGDLDNERAEEAFCDEVARVLRLGRFAPDAVAVDQHPELPSSRFAEERFSGTPIIRVQHHHAHLAAVMVEHGLGAEAEVAGIVLDGFGFGSDGTIWGGEVLVGGYRAFQRRAHLRAVPQPGGDRAAAEPGRMATSLLVDAGLSEPGRPGFDPRVAHICGIPAVSPLTSSAGRLFDGVAALLGIAPERQEYEGEAAVRLESCADGSVQDAYPLPLDGGVLDTRALTRAVVDDRAPVAVRAARFINGLADGLIRAVPTRTSAVVLGGGCVVNRRLLRRLVDRLENRGKTVLIPRRLPPGDGGLSAGQAMVAAYRLWGGA